MSEENKTNAPPVFKVNVGDIEAAVWEQNGKNGTFLTISHTRNYLDANDKTGGENGTWKKTNTLRVNDLPKAQLAFAKCYEYAKLTHGKKAE